MKSKKETGPDNFDISSTALGSAVLGVTNIVMGTDAKQREQMQKGFEEFFSFVEQHKKERGLIPVETVGQTEEAGVMNPEVKKVRKGVIDSAISGLVNGLKEIMLQKGNDEREKGNKYLENFCEEIRQRVEHFSGERVLE